MQFRANLQVFIFDTFVNYSLIAVITRARTIFVSVVPFPVTWRREPEARGSNERAAVYQKVAACRGRVITRHLTFCCNVEFSSNVSLPINRRLFAPNVSLFDLAMQAFLFFKTRSITSLDSSSSFHCSKGKTNSPG